MTSAFITGGAKGDNHGGRFVSTGRTYRRGLFLLLISGVLPWAGAQSIPIYVPTNGQDLRDLPLLEKTVTFLNEHLRDHEFELVLLSEPDEIVRPGGPPVGLAFLDPPQLVRLESSLSLSLIASVARNARRQETCKTGGAFVTLRDLSLPRLDDMRELTMVTVGGDSQASWVAVRRELAARRADWKTIVGKRILAPNDQAAIDRVLNKQAEIGVVAAGVLEQLAADGQVNLADFRIIPLRETTPGTAAFPFQVSTRLYPERVLAALPGTDPELARQVAAQLLSATLEALDSTGVLNARWTLTGSLEETRQALRELRLPPYEEYGKVSIAAVLRQHTYWLLGAGALLVILGLIVSYVMTLNRALGEEIEERKAAQRSLKESIERFEYLASCSGEWIWETDAQERFTYSNKALEKLLGWSPKELMGKPYFDLLSSAEKEKLGDQKKLLGSEDAPVFHRRVTLLTVDGRLAVHDCTAGPVRDKQGQITGYRGVNRDVTAEARVVSFR